MAARRIVWLALGSTALSLAALATAPRGGYDPLALARASRGVMHDLEAGVPPQCYTKTAGIANPCWTCHVVSEAPNHRDDFELQREYSFSDEALQNRWTNLFADRRDAIAAVGDAELLAWIRADNYAPLRRALAARADYEGWRPDLDLHRGFDDEGLALDGSGWRALRFKPFPGTFWATNGSTSDAFLRLPAEFRRDADGRPSRATALANHAILEQAITSAPGAALPDQYVGAAAGVPVEARLYPVGTEFLHTVRYVDPDAPNLMSARLKELRYSRKVRALDAWARLRAYERETDDKQAGRLPIHAGWAEAGVHNGFGWLYQGFIEDPHGRLRLQTDEEHRFCTGCHGSLGVTIDHSFAFPRKLPGRDGWRWQDLRGMPDAPQAGHPDPEILTWLRRVTGGDEFRANQEMLARFFPGGQLDEVQVRRAAPGGDRDLEWLIAPSRERAVQLGKAYLQIVREQSFTRGRDAVVGPVELVHERIENGSTDLQQTGRVFLDGRLRLDW